MRRIDLLDADVYIFFDVFLHGWTIEIIRFDLCLLLFSGSVGQLAEPAFYANFCQRMSQRPLFGCLAGFVREFPF